MEVGIRRRGLVNGLKVPCLFMIAEVSIRCQKNLEVGNLVYAVYPRIPPNTPLVINPAVGCHYFPPGLQLPQQPLRGLLPISLLGEQRHNGCEQFA